MPRRPRPATRRPPPHSSATRAVDSPKTLAELLHRVPSDVESEDDSGEEDSEESVQSPSEDEYGNEEEEGEADAGADTPRVAQWIDDEELEGGSSKEESSEDEQENERLRPGSMKRLQEDLSSLPLGTLRKAHNALARDKTLRYNDADGESADSRSSEEYASPSEEGISQGGSQGKGKEPRAKREIQKRAHKHAPMEMSSKRPVPRKKPDIEDKRPVPRDPRFLHIAGEFDPSRFRTQYGFLSELHQDELKTLKDNLKRARKLLTTSPRDLRHEREQEVQQLERAVKRAESTVNRDRREKIEESALSKVKKAEREKREKGKGAWFMKDSEKKELLTRAKFEALAESGGRGAVRKAIEKKQKKVNQKEKKKRPFVPGENGKWPARSVQHDTRPNKRQRSS